MSNAGDGAIAAVVILIAFVCLLGGGVAGFSDWPLWSVPLLALPLALNRGNTRAMIKDNSWSRFTMAFLVGLPVSFVFVAISYAIGFGIQQLAMKL